MSIRDLLALIVLVVLGTVIVSALAFTLFPDVPVPSFPSESPPAAPVYGPGLTPGIPTLDSP